MEWNYGQEEAAARLVVELVATVLDCFNNSDEDLDVWRGSVYIGCAFSKASVDNPQLALEIRLVGKSLYRSYNPAQLHVVVAGRNFSSDLSALALSVALRFLAHLMTLVRRPIAYGSPKKASVDGNEGLMIELIVS